MSPAPEADPRSDADLLADHAAGDPDAFALLFRRHGDRLWGLALRTCGQREDAADALQDAMTKAAQSAAGFRGESAVTTWLHRIVVNACLDRLRREAVRPATALAPELLDGALDAAARVSGAAGPDVADRVALQVDVERALAALPAEQRAALVLVDVLGHDVATAADLLGCPEGTIKSRCARGRARLAPALAHLRNPAASATVEPPVVPGLTGPRATPRPAPADGGEPS